MKKLLPFALTMMELLMAGNTALADYVNPPGWEKAPCYTHQCWDFNKTGEDERGNPLPPKEPFLPDGKSPMVNPYGHPVYTFYAADVKYFDWSDTPMRMKGWTRHGMWAAMDAGVPAGLVFHIPNSRGRHLKRELWLQYVISQYNGSVFTTAVYADENKHFTMISRDRKALKSGGGGGSWSRITEIWRETTPGPPLVHVKIELNGNTGLIEQVSMDTRCVPDPDTSLR
jgi:hypothetical protein